LKREKEGQEECEQKLGLGEKELECKNGVVVLQLEIELNGVEM
jgi:hypothetical protein